MPAVITSVNVDYALSESVKPLLANLPKYALCQTHRSHSEIDSLTNTLEDRLSDFENTIDEIREEVEGLREPVDEDQEPIAKDQRGPATEPEDRKDG